MKTIKIMNIKEVIRRHRFNIVLHSQMYYYYDNPIWSDTKFDNVCKALCKLQKDYPDESRRADGYNAFKDFDGSTGVQFCNSEAVEYFSDYIDYIYLLHQAKDKTFQRYAKNRQLKKIKHTVPMLGLEKCHTYQEAIDWENNLKYLLKKT